MTRCLLFVFLLCAMPSWAITVVQSRVSIGSFGSATLAFSGANTSGNLLTAAVFNAANSSTFTVSGSVNGSYTAVGSPNATSAGGGGTIQIFYFKNCATGTDSVTVTSTPGGLRTEMVIVEYSGADTVGPLDGNNTGTGSTSGTIATGNFTTTGTNDVIVAWGWSPGVLSSFTGYTTEGTTSNGLYSDIFTNTAGTNSAQMTIGGGGNTWIISGAAFKPSAAAAAHASTIVGAATRSGPTTVQ